jgi:hypothetical protein
VRRGVQPPPEGTWGDERGSGNDPWLMDAGRSLQQALDEGHPIDWRREFLRRKVPATPPDVDVCPAASAVKLTRVLIGIAESVGPRGDLPHVAQQSLRHRHSQVRQQCQHVLSFASSHTHAHHTHTQQAIEEVWHSGRHMPPDVQPRSQGAGRRDGRVRWELISFEARRIRPNLLSRAREQVIQIRRVRRQSLHEVRHDRLLCCHVRR